MRLIIHAGIHRTGTTSIQKALERNRLVLAARGIHYPDSQGGRHRDVLRHLQAGDDPVRLMNELQNSARSGTETIILSNEDFAKQKDLSWLAAVCQHFDVQIYIYLIRQDYWAMSWYSQNVKSAWNSKIAELRPADFLNHLKDYHWLDYAQLAARWTEHADEGAVHLRVLEKEQITDSTSDFFGQVVGNPEGLDLSRSRLNVSLSPPVLEAKRRINALQLPSEKRAQISAAMLESSKHYSERAPIYPPQVRNDVVEMYRESNAQVARSYLGRDDGQLFLEGPVPDDAPYEEPRLPESSEELWDNIMAPLIRTIYSA